MTLKVFPCVHTETYVSMRLWFVVWVAVVLTPAYFASHHLLFGSWYSWWVAFAAWVRVMWKRPVDQEETCGCERQMPGPTVLHTESNLVWYPLCFHHPCWEATLRGKWHISLMAGMCQVQYAVLWGQTCGYERLVLLSYLMWCTDTNPAKAWLPTTLCRT